MRQPKPDALKQLQGTDRADRINPEQPQWDCVVEAKAPDYFNSMERKVWDNIVPQLIKQKLFQTIDQATVVILCQSLANYHTLHSLTRGKFGKVENGKVTCDNEVYKLYQIQQMALKTAIDLMKQYGFTPVARQKMMIPPDQDTGAHPGKKQILPPKPSIDVGI